MKADKSKQIRKALIDSGLTQAKIAAELGVERQVVNAVIHGRAKSKRVALKIKELTGIAI